MKNKFLLTALIIVFITPSLWAQDKIYSLALKEYEIEEAIRKSLNPFLNKEDYVVKVRLTGEKRVDKIIPEVKESREITGEGLPGFELQILPTAEKIPEIVGNTYWAISKMRIDLVMHKDISPSVDTFIRETVPVVSDLNPARGDVFNFVPIIPRILEEEQVEKLTSDAVKEPSYYGLTIREWMYIGLGLLLLIIVLILLWRLARMRQNIYAMQETIEEGRFFEKEHETEVDHEKAEKEKAERKAQHESMIKESILKEKSDKTLQGIITQLLGRRDWIDELYEEFNQDKQGVDKLARFIKILGPSTSRRLFADIMGEERYLELEGMAENVKEDVEQDNALLQEIRKILFAKKLTSPERTSFDPFSFLKELTVGQIGFLIKDEPVKIKSIVISQLNSRDSAAILSKLSKEERGKVLTQLGHMDNLPLELAEKVAYNLADKAREVPSDSTVGFDGIDMVVEVISESDPNTRTDMINNLRVSDRDLSEKVESRFFLFDSIPVVPNDILVDVVRRLPPDDVITAIVGSSKQLQEKVIMCFPEKNRRTLVASLKAQRPTPEVVRQKQRLIVKAMQQMARDNKVDLRKIKAAWDKATSKKPTAKSA